MISLTVSLSINRVSCKHKPIFCFRNFSFSLVHSLWKSFTTPSVGFCNPSNISKRVVFPAPLGPKTETKVPGGISRSIPFNAQKSLKRFFKFFYFDDRIHNLLNNSRNRWMDSGYNFVIDGICPIC
jgi:hypothetical protein